MVKKKKETKNDATTVATKTVKKNNGSIQSESTMMTIISRLVLILVISTVALITTLFYAYPQSLLTGEWILDDKVAVLHNPLVSHILPHYGGGNSRPPLSALWERDFWGVNDLTDGKSHKSWRPICTLCYRWQYDIIMNNDLFDESYESSRGFVSEVKTTKLLADGRGFPTAGGGVMGQAIEVPRGYDYDVIDHETGGRQPWTVVKSGGTIDPYSDEVRLVWWFRLFDRFLHGIVSGLCVPVVAYVLMGYLPVTQSKGKDTTATTPIVASIASGEMNATTWIWLLSILVGFMFGLHPIHVESVANTTGRAEVLCAFFYLLGFLSYVRVGFGARLPSMMTIFQRETVAIPLLSSTLSTVRYSILGSVITLALSMASMLCKEHGITLPVLCIAWDAFVGTDTSLKEIFKHLSNGWRSSKGTTKKRLEQCRMFLFRTILLSIGTIVVVLWRSSKNGNTGRPDFSCEQNPVACEDHFLTRFAHYSYLWCFNFFLLLVPRRLSCDWTGGAIPIWMLDGSEGYAELVGGESGGDFIDLAMERIPCLVVLWTVLVILAFWTFQEVAGVDKEDNTGTVSTTRWWQKISVLSGAVPRTILVSFLWMFLPFILSSNLFVTIGLVVADRTLYLPCLGFCILLVQGLVLFSSLYVLKENADSNDNDNIGKKNKNDSGAKSGNGNAKKSVFSFVLTGSVIILSLYAYKQRHNTRLWTKTELVWGEAHRVNKRGFVPRREYAIGLVNSNRNAEAVPILLEYHIKSFTNPWGLNSTRDARMRRQGLKRSETDIKKTSWGRLAGLMQTRFVLTSAMTYSGDIEGAKSLVIEGLKMIEEILPELKEEIEIEQTFSRRSKKESFSSAAVDIFSGILTERAALLINMSKVADNMAEMAKYAEMAIQSSPNHGEVQKHSHAVKGMLQNAKQANMDPKDILLRWMPDDSGSGKWGLNFIPAKR